MIKRIDKKGFTLIELLAVIIVLTIIALIAIPRIFNIIENARKESFRNSAYGLISASELSCTLIALESDGVISSKIYNFDTGLIDGLDFMGETPAGGRITVDENCNVEIIIHNNEWCAIKSTSDEEVRLIRYDDGCGHDVTWTFLVNIENIERPPGLPSIVDANFGFFPKNYDLIVDWGDGNVGVYNNIIPEFVMPELEFNSNYISNINLTQDLFVHLEGMEIEDGSSFYDIGFLEGMPEDAQMFHAVSLIAYSYLAFEYYDESLEILSMNPRDIYREKEELFNELEDKVFSLTVLQEEEFIQMLYNAMYPYGDVDENLIQVINNLKQAISMFIGGVDEGFYREGMGITHFYEEPGVYEVTISGTLDYFSFVPYWLYDYHPNNHPYLEGEYGFFSFSYHVSDILTPIPIEIGIVDASYMFAGMNLEDITASNLLDEASENIINMEGMFLDSHISNINLSNWNVSNVEKFSKMFYGANIVDFDIIGWDTSSAQHINEMLCGSYNVTDYDHMISIQNSLDLSNVLNLTEFGLGCHFLLIG